MSDGGMASDRLRSTGVARRVDALGRIVLPVELRRLHGIQTGDELEISVDGDSIVLRKLTDGCVFCGGVDDLSAFMDKLVCAPCRTRVADTAE